MLYLLDSLHLQAQKEFKMLVLPSARVLGKTCILSILTHLQPEMSMKNRQIPRDFLTCPYNLEKVAQTKQ